MLNLHTPTRDDWADEALSALEEVLIDHAHCEKKAASTAINLIFRYADQLSLLTPLSALAREELAHFEMVLSLLAKRGLSFRRLEPAPYAARLMAAVRKPEPHRLLDTLLCCALIEARSCERMQLLRDALADAHQVHAHQELSTFYGSLLASEARHYASYVELALGLFPADEVHPRLQELAEHEASVLAGPSGAVRMHS